MSPPDAPTFDRLHRTSWLVVALWVASLAACGGPGARRVTDELDRPPVSETARLDAERAKWQQPVDIVDGLRLKPGMRLAVMSAGDAYLLPHLATAVGDDGRVFALEWEAPLVDRTRAGLVLRGFGERGHKPPAGAAPVEVRRVALSSWPVPEPVDRAVLINSYPTLEAPVEALALLRRWVKPGGLIAVIDYPPDEAVPGPPIDTRLDVETVIAEARGAGLAVSLRYNVLPRQYFLVFVNAEETDPSPDPVLGAQGDNFAEDTP